MGASKPQRWAIEGRLSSYLDMIRWSAALIVVLSHTKSLFFRNYSDLTEPEWYLKPIYAISSLGHQAVIVFFVLSGLLISANVMKAVDGNRWSWRTYLLHRLSRLYIVLIPALLLGFLWDYFGIARFGETGVYDGLPEDVYILNYSSSGLLDLRQFIGNLFFLQGIVTDHFGSNGPLWSLSYEFWYYILFPCLVLMFGSKVLTFKFLYASLCIGLIVLMGGEMLLYFFVWLCGFGIHLLPRTLTSKWYPAVALWPVSAFLAIALEARFYPLFYVAEDFMLAIAFSGLLYGLKLITAGKPSLSPKLQRAASSLSGYSYSLYLAHFPALVFLHAMVYDRLPYKWKPDAFHLGYAALLVLGINGYAWLLSQLTEKHTIKARNTVERRLLNRLPSRKSNFTSTDRQINS